MKKIKVAILKNEDPYDHHNWIRACENFAQYVQYSIVDMMKNTWLGELQNQSFDCLLAKPGAKTSLFRQLYEEILKILVNELGYKVFPSLDEIQIYENKRYLSYWLQANQLPHPATAVFYNKQEALEHISQQDFPCVGKMNIGASGDGVVILHDRYQGREYVEKAFSKGLKNRTGPKLFQKNLLRNKIEKLANPKKLMNRLKTYKAVAQDLQLGFVILQEFIPHDFEWRVVRIGESFFAHKKVKKWEKASGSLTKKYENPPIELLNFVRKITDRFKFYSQAIDIFHNKDNKYLINEMQCIFGQSDPFQMKVDGRIGRYIIKDNNWVFEEGDFNSNESFDLRVAHVIKVYGDGQWPE